MARDGPAPGPPPIIVDDWLGQETNGNPRAEFSRVAFPLELAGKVKCVLSCNHRSSYVSADGIAGTCGDAFEIAREKIGLTIGPWW